MIIGPLFITFTYPLFIYLASLLALAAWHWKSKRRALLLPHSHSAVVDTRKRKLVGAAQKTIVSLSALAAVGMLFASLSPQIVKTIDESSNARRIAVVCDLSGSMTIGLDEDDSPLPAAEKTRLGQAGRFMQKLADKRSGDAFAIVCFNTESYVARDFTTDVSQIKEFLTPADLVGILKNLETMDVPESARIKERAIHDGTWALGGVERAIKFITSHPDYTGKEILIYLGDLEAESGEINKYFVSKLAEIRKESGLEIYAVVISRDYGVSPENQMTADFIAQKKIRVFDGTNIPAYAADNPRDIEKIAARIAQDIPKSQVKEEITKRYLLAPWALFASFILILAVLILNEKFPRIP